MFYLIQQYILQIEWHVDKTKTHELVNGSIMMITEPNLHQKIVHISFIQYSKH
jgi:hypothetical protein